MQHHLKPFRISWRFLRLLIHILIGLLLALLFLRRFIHPNTLAAQLSLWWHRRVCQIFGVRLQSHGTISPVPTLFVINHISWFDIPALGSVLPVHFLSKDEINSWPIIGWLASKSGTLFIKRGHRGAAEQSIQDISRALRNGGHVIVFPEGTTTNGESVARFHSRLFQAAIDANTPVQPVALRYPHPDGVHPSAPFIGDTQFLDSTLDMMSEPSMDVELQFLPAIMPTGRNRDELARLCREKILNVIRVPTSS